MSGGNTVQQDNKALYSNIMHPNFSQTPLSDVILVAWRIYITGFGKCFKPGHFCLESRSLNFYQWARGSRAQYLEVATWRSSSVSCWMCDLSKSFHLLLPPFSQMVILRTTSIKNCKALRTLPGTEYLLCNCYLLLMLLLLDLFTS